MFKSSLNRKLFGFFGAVLMTFNSFAFGPWNNGKAVREKHFSQKKTEVPQEEKKYQDPLLPFIYPDAKVTPYQFQSLLKNMSDEQRKDLWKALKATDKDPKNKITAEALQKELIWASSHWVTYPFKSNQADYHATVKWCAKQLDVHKAECEAATTFQLERRIMEKVFAQMWDKLTPEQRTKILIESGVEPDKAVAYSSLGASAVIAAMGISAAVMKFQFYILVAKTLAAFLAHLLGIRVTTTIVTVSVLCGPIGWIVTGLATVGGGLLLGRANVGKTAGFIIAIHAIKATAMHKSGVDVSQYILK